MEQAGGAAYNPFSLSGKIILVTGASSGIGRSIAVECSKMGARMVITGRNAERLTQTLEALEGSDHLLLTADLTQEDQIDGLVDACPALDGVVHSAGIAKLVLLPFFKKRDLDEIFSANTFAPIMLSSRLAKRKRIKSGGSVVFISATSGVDMSSVGESLYSASKGAIHGFVKGMALDLASKQIRVNAINPGLVPTDILNVASDIFSIEEVLQRRASQYPLGRFGTPQDIAMGAIFLLSDASTWVTGSAMKIDGGLTLGAI